MTDDADHYEMYPCLVDGAPASIYVNLRYEAGGPAHADTRYSVEMPFADAGPHGIGSSEDGEAMNAIEEKMIAALGDLIYVGRVRNRGTWETTFYGPAGRADAVRAAAPKKAQLHTEADPSWRYYRELLLPDGERRQWIDDRRLVQILREQGDPLTTPRRVDHWATFETPAARTAFLEIATRAGFTADDAEGNEVRVHRVDPIELDHIHDVVMILVDAATKVGGTYDGWETSIETGS